MAFIISGVVFCIVGLFIPWVSVSMTGTGMNVGARSLTGFELNQGLIGAGAGLVGGLLGVLGARGTIPPKLAGAVAAIAGLVLVVVSAAVIFDSGSTSVTSGPFRMTSRVSPMPGVFICAIGGVLLLIGGIRVFRED